MLICKADTKPVEHILFLEPRQSEAITNNPVYVAAVTKYYLHYTLKTTLEFLSRADETLECQNERTTDEVKHLRFALLHRKVKRTVANYIDDYRHSNNLSEDEHDVVSSFLEFLMNFWNIENFMMEIDVACPAFKRHQKENTTKQYCEDTYYICLTVYMSHEIDNKYEKEQVKLMIWRKLARQMYLDALYPWFKAKYLKCLAGKELHLKHHSPIECKKSDNFYNNIIDFLNRISNSKNNPIDFDRGPAVAFDIGPYLIGYFVDNTLEINLGENFMHKKDIVADLLSYLRVEDRYKETIQRLSKKCDKILWFHIFNYESDVAAALSFTAINNDRIQLCKYQTAVISLISDSYIHNLSNTFLIEFKKNRVLARGVISKSSYSIRNIFRHDKGTETLFSAIKLTNDLIVRIIHNGVDPYKTLQTKIYDEIKNLLYFCVRNQQTTQIDKLNRICGFEPEVKNDVDQNSQVKKHKQAHSGAQTDFRCKYNQKTLKELEGERLCQNKSKNIYVKADSSKIQRSTHTKSLAKTFEKEDQHGQTIPEIFDHQAQAEESKSEGLPTESHSRDNEPENCCNQYETKEDLEPDEALAIRLSSQNQNKKSKVMDEDTDIERPSKHELKLPKDIKNMPDNVHNLSGTAKVKLPETNDKFKLATEIYQQCEMTEQKQLVNFEEEIGKNHCNSMINSHIQESADQNQYDGDLTHIGKNNSISVDTVARDFSQHNESFVMNKKNCQEANTHNREHLQNYPKDTRHTHNDDLVSQQSANFINVKSGTFGMTATEIISDTKTSKISVDQSKLLSPDPCVDTLETKKQIVTKSDESKAKNTQSFTVGRNGKSKHKIPDTLTSTSMMSHETCIGQVAEHEVSKPLPEGHNDNKHFDTKTGKANASSWNCQRNKARAALQIGPGRQTLAPRFQRSLYFRPRDSQCKQSSKPSTNAQLTASDPQTPSIPETNPSIYHDAANQQNINLAQNKSIDNGQNQIASSRQTEVAVSVETSSQQTPSLQKTMQRENSNPISQDLVNDGNCIERENAKFRNHCRLVYATHDYGHMSRNSEVLVRFSTLHLNNIPYTDGIDE